MGGFPVYDRWRWIVVFGLLGIAGVAVGGGKVVRIRREADLRERWRVLLVSATETRGDALERWIADAGREAGAIAGFPTVLYMTGGLRGKDTPFPPSQGAAPHLDEILARFAKDVGHRRVWVLDGAGRLVASSDTDLEPLAFARDAARQAINRRQASVVFGGAPEVAAAAFASPVTSRSSAVGAVVITEELAGYVFPLLADSKSSGSVELFLIERRGDEVKCLSPRRKPARVAGALEDIASTGNEAIHEVRDYSGAAVFAAVRDLSVPGLSIVAQVDRDEALAPAGREAWLAAAALLGTGLALSPFVLLVLRRSQEAHTLELAGSEARAALILDNMNDSVLFTDETFRIADANRAAETLYGRSRTELVSLTTIDLHSPETRPAGNTAWAEIRDESRMVFEGEHMHRDGTRFPVEVAVRGVQVAGRQMYLGLVRDLRERKRAEESLRLAVDAAKLGTWDWDLRSGLLAWGGHHAELFGLGPDAFDGRYETFLERVHPDDRELVAARTEESRLRRREYQCEYRIVWPDGSIHWVMGRGRYDYNEAGEAVRMRGAVQETTALRRVADDLRNLFRAIEQSPVSVVITNAAGEIEYVNPCFSEVTGYSRGEALGQNPRLLKSGQHTTEFYTEMWAALKSGSEWRGQLTNKRKDGRLFTEEVVISPVIDEEHRISHFIAVKQDVTELHRRDEALRASRQQLAQAQKMEAVGRLAGGMAHDFNNLLGVILGYAELALRRIPEEDPVYRKLEEIAKAAERGGALTRQLLAYSRKQVLAPTVVDLNSTLRDVSGMLTRLIGEDVAMVVEPGLDLRRVRIDRGQIEQVLLNLVANSRDAMPDGGQLTLRTSNEDVGEDDPRRRGLMPAGLYVRLAITDTGVGMNEEVLGHLFEPFFTTKEHGRGTGLGLPTVYGIVKQSNGFVWVGSTPGQGTTFEVFLPAVSDAPTPVAHRVGAVAGGAHDWVLIVEDNETLRAVEREVLAQAGYRVLQAADGDAAVAIARQHGERIALLLSDVVLPKRSGPEIAVDIRRLQPGIKMLFTSGYTADTASVQRILDAGHAFLNKPVTPEALLAKIAEVLGR